MAARALACLALVALAAAAGTGAGAAPDQPRGIFDPWSWLPTRQTKSASIMDYFFPPSRTPKQSTLNVDISSPTSTTKDTTRVPFTTQDHGTTQTKKTSLASSTKSKLSQTQPQTTVVVTSSPKTKKPSSKIPETTFSEKTTYTSKDDRSTLSTQPLTTYKMTTTTEKPKKHYTIHPIRTVPTLQEIRTTYVDKDTSETVYDSKSEEIATEKGETETPTVAASTVTIGESRATSVDSESTVSSAGTTSTPGNSTLNADDLDSREGSLQLRDKPQQTHVKINEQTKKETVPLPAGSTSVLAKPTKYHYYPHNQHIYLLPECAIQQVCNAVYVRLNYTQPLCACPARYRDPCSASLNADDLHTTRLTTDSKKKYASRAVTLVKTCEAVSEMRECRAPRDWSLLALQNIRTGKSHYLVICRCPEQHILEGPMSHDQPTYASVPGIRVYGMMCVKPAPGQYQPNTNYNSNRFTAITIQTTTSAYKVDFSQPHFNPDKPAYNQAKPDFNRFQGNSFLGNQYFNRVSRAFRARRDTDPPFPWYKVQEFAKSIDWD